MAQTESERDYILRSTAVLQVKCNKRKELFYEEMSIRYFAPVRGAVGYCSPGISACRKQLGYSIRLFPLGCITFVILENILNN